MQHKNHLLIYNGKGMGGVQSLILNIAFFLNKKNETVYLLIPKDSKIFKELPQNSDIQWIDYSKVTPGTLGFHIRYWYNTEIDNFINSMSSLMKLSSNTTVWTFDFNGFQLGLVLLKKHECKVLTGFFHPEYWKNSCKISFCGHRLPYINPRIQSYQRKILTNFGSDFTWFMSLEVKKSHEDFINSNIHSKIIPLPFRTPTYPPPNILWQGGSKPLKCVWIGRFDYFKNPSLYCAYKSLSCFSNKHNIPIFFDIIGFGSNKWESEIKRLIPENNKLVTTSFIGEIRYSQLNSFIYGKYNLALCMGTSALHTASCYIPTIVLDGARWKNIDLIQGAWIDECPKGVLGGGVYADLSGLDYHWRNPLNLLLEQTLKPNFLAKKMISSNEHVIRYYDAKQILEELYAFANKYGISYKDIDSYPIYHTNLIIKIIRRLAMKLIGR